MEVRPLRQITGSSDFNEMFFTNVRVPRTNVVGEINGGWRVAISTLSSERGTLALATAVDYVNIFDDLVKMARHIIRNGRAGAGRSVACASNWRSSISTSPR